MVSINVTKNNVSISKKECKSIEKQEENKIEERAAGEKENFSKIARVRQLN